MSEIFWLAKIRGLLYSLDLNGLERCTGIEAQPHINDIKALLQQFQDPSLSNVPDISYLADLLTDASDRAVLNLAQLNIPGNTLQVSHLLSGEKLFLPQALSACKLLKQQQEQSSASPAPPNTSPQQIDVKQLFWWLWRCLPQAVCKCQGDEAMLLPAATNLPDASVWSHASLTAAMAGALTGYDPTSTQSTAEPIGDHPYLAIFSFTPVQELIKASRKMRDFWAGSWVLHYLSAKICWTLAQKYGPDSLIYPSLYQQPLIDHWLLQTWFPFQTWVTQPTDRQLLTAGFPNVIVLVLPKNCVEKAMQLAEQTVKEEWKKLGHSVFEFLKSPQCRWMPDLQEDNKTWSGWLKSQWQTYWTALPVGSEGQGLISQAISPDQAETLKNWLKLHNDACNLEEKQQLFYDEELKFLQAVYQHNSAVSVNVGSWWPYIFDQLRFALSSVKGSRTWEVPTAFGPRSTISGIGPVVYPYAEEKGITEGDTEKCWKKHAALFDGIEELNATEVLKRGLHRVLPKVLFPKQPVRWTQRLPEFYPDLSSGVAGWLRSLERRGDVRAKAAIQHYFTACETVKKRFSWTQEADSGEVPPAELPWGIPWIAEKHPDWSNPRLLNPGWLIDDFEPSNPNPELPFTKTVQSQLKQKQLKELRECINEQFPNNNPTDWYILAAGDGDGMSNWLKGKPLKKYQDYIPTGISAPGAIQGSFQEVQTLKKRMGPSTHNALSRALLDFSNQLVPYLTEQRHTGRLIYSGGDDVLAYTNLWEWDSWLWDIRQCFRGAEDPLGEANFEQREFDNQGDYWQWRKEEGKLPQNLSSRPLFTMGHAATISFGVVIAHSSVPLAIALENLWSAEEAAKEHYCPGIVHPQKNAVQVRVLYSSGNILKATSKFAAQLSKTDSKEISVFNQWRSLLIPDEQIPITIDSAIFEQAAQLWMQHPAPHLKAIEPWTQAFCTRRELFAGNDTAREVFRQKLSRFLTQLWQTTDSADAHQEIQNWLKLAAFVLRNRYIKVN